MRHANAGFSLVEVLTAMAFLGMIALTVTSLSTLTSKSQQSVHAQNDWVGFKNYVAGMMSDPENCAALLKRTTKFTPGNTVSLDQLFLPDGVTPLIQTVSTPIGKGGFGLATYKMTYLNTIEISSIKVVTYTTPVLQSYPLNGNTYSPYVAELSIIANRVGSKNTLGFPPIPFTVSLDSNNLLYRCSTSGTANVNSNPFLNCAAGSIITAKADGTYQCISSTCSGTNAYPVGAGPTGLQCCEYGQYPADWYNGAPVCCPNSYWSVPPANGSGSPTCQPKPNGGCAAGSTALMTTSAGALCCRQTQNLNPNDPSLLAETGCGTPDQRSEFAISFWSNCWHGWNTGNGGDVGQTWIVGIRPYSLRINPTAVGAAGASVSSIPPWDNTGAFLNAVPPSIDTHVGRTDSSTVDDGTIITSWTGGFMPIPTPYITPGLNNNSFAGAETECKDVPGTQPQAGSLCCYYANQKWRQQ